MRRGATKQRRRDEARRDDDEDSLLTSTKTRSTTMETPSSSMAYSNRDGDSLLHGLLQPRRFNMTQNRAKWTARYEKGIVEILTEYNLSHYHGQNGWTTEGWNQVVKELNNLYPDAGFTKDRVQDKEAQLKKHYKNIKSIVNRSGISWNDVACVINTTPEKWEEVTAEDSKLKMYEGKSFPLYEALGVLYEGHIAQGRY
ncbi:hypothetical protein ZWY2020_056873 [Hordeum vulgare]|nr:hypothetical protein ZWY2020_056873 [Hordeum vulgare]